MSIKSDKEMKKGQRQDGLFAVYLDVTKWLGAKPGGKRNRKAFYGKTPEEAEAAKKAYLADLESGAPLDSHTITVSEWCDRWKNAYKSNVHGTNELSLNVQLNRLKKDLGSLRMRDVRNMHIQGSLNKMTGMSKSAISKYRMVVQQVFKRAHQNKIILDNPALDLLLPEGSEGSHRALERWEVNTIMDNWHVHRCGLWAMLMLFAGLRRGEMIALDWKNVDLKERTINVYEAAEIISNQPVMQNKTKTKAGLRVLPICAPLLDALLTVPEKKRSGLVCVSADGSPISYSAFVRGWDGFNTAMTRVLNNEPVDQQGTRNDLSKKDRTGTIDKVTSSPVKIEGSDTATPRKTKKERLVFSVRAHDLRYTFATALYDAMMSGSGFDVKAAQYYLGHSDIRMTMNIYTQLSDERENESRKRTVDFLDSWISKGRIENEVLDGDDDDWQ